MYFQARISEATGGNSGNTGEHTRRASFTHDTKQLRKSYLHATNKERKRRQGEAILRTRREEALCEAEGVTYEAGRF